MGRGRAKAKQQKVARELKYNSHFTDLDALQRELSGQFLPIALKPLASKMQLHCSFVNPSNQMD